jgi:hypothetical protein
VHGDRALGRLAARNRLIDDDVGAVAEQLVGAGEDALDVVGAQVRVERLARRPALDERESASATSRRRAPAGR